jgi:hypothetical protein
VRILEGVQPMRGGWKIELALRIGREEVVSLWNAEVCSGEGLSMHEEFRANSFTGAAVDGAGGLGGTSRTGALEQFGP